MSNQWEPEGIFEVLASKESRRILAAASVRPVTAQELEQVCDASLPTIYRRLTVLTEYDLLSKGRGVDTDQMQSNQYTTDVQQITVEIADGELSVNLELEKDTVDKFGELFRDLEGGGGRASSSQTEFSFGSTSEEQS